MRITFVNPNLGGGEGGPYVPRGRMEPLVFAVLAALTPPDVELRLYDDRIEPVPFDRPTDLVALTVETFSARRAYELADAYRRRGVPVVMGGFHPTVVPDEAALHADAVVVGEAEGLWPAIVEDARRGRLERVYREPGRTRMGGVRLRREIFDGKPYLPIRLVHFSRGCTYGCEFCALSCYYRPRFNRRPVEDALADAAAVRDRLLFFTDDNIGGDREAALELFRGLGRLGVRWCAQISVDLLADASLVALMARAGCRGVLVGFESLAPAALSEMGKRSNDPSVYGAAVANLRRHGVLHWSSFLLGYDSDGPDVFDRTVDFAIRMRSCISAFNPLTPYPGTALYDRLEAEGRLLHDGAWWLAPGYRFGDVPFVPRRMTAEELSDGCMRARLRFTSAGSVLRRATDLRANLRSPGRALFFFSANRVSRRDALAKHRMRLGLGG